MGLMHSYPHLTASEAAALIPDGAFVGFSGFTHAGDAKAVPRALAERAREIHARGEPFVGQAGKLLDKLLGGIGLTRADVFVANVLKCRPPGNRDPLPEEIAACEPHLFHQIELIQPRVVATLGNFATKLLSGRPLGITRVHGQPQDVTLGGNSVTLYPLYHPAAALYTPSMLTVLEQDFARLPGLLGAPVPAPAPEPADVPAAFAAPPAPAEHAVQLDLF